LLTIVRDKLSRNLAPIGLLLGAVLLAASPSLAATRHYYIAAEDVTWDYAPSGRDLIHGSIIPKPWTSQTRFLKTRYFEYTDATFTMRKPQPEWLGILGPMIRAEVGDTIVVDFINRGQSPHSMHPHGLRYDKDNEGAMYLPAGRGGAVPPGGRFTYHWFADTGSGPGPGELSSKVWWYHAHTDEARETNAGLLGPIIITAKGKAKADGSPKDVDHEFVALFMLFDQLQGKDAGLFYSINGYIFGNLPGFVMKQGEHIRWYLLGMGSEKDLHSPHWHGKTVSDKLRNTDVVELLPGSMVTVDMAADNPGTWLFHCHVSDHMENGMMAVYTIYQPSTRQCPIQFVSGSFWNTDDKFSMKIENVSDKPIKSLTMESDYFLSEQYLHRPFQEHMWAANQTIAPGQQYTLEKKSYPANEEAKILGWAFSPEAVTFADGTIWKPQQDGECFHVFWRDKDHPELNVLPPLQKEMNLD
jgi:manganese oxidase